MREMNRAEKDRERKMHVVIVVFGNLKICQGNQTRRCKRLRDRLRKIVYRYFFYKSLPSGSVIEFREDIVNSKLKRLHGTDDHEELVLTGQTVMKSWCSLVRNT